MRIAIFGAGAIGGYMGARLAASGVDVTLIARGPHLAAMQRDGLRLIEFDGTETVTHPRLVADSREAGAHDYVILAVKAHSVSPALDAILPLIGPDTAVVTAQNGVPWWYFYGIDSPYRDRHLESVDPGGRIWDAIGPQRAIGCVVYPACEIEAPGVIRHDDDENRFSLGEPDNTRSERAAGLAAALNAAGLRAPLRRNIRGEIWVKLWGNVAMNPISALTRATLAQIGADPSYTRLCPRRHAGGRGRSKRPRREDGGGRGRPPQRRRRGRRAQDLDAPGPRARPADGGRRHRRVRSSS